MLYSFQTQLNWYPQINTCMGSLHNLHIYKFLFYFWKLLFGFGPLPFSIFLLSGICLFLARMLLFFPVFQANRPFYHNQREDQRRFSPVYFLDYPPILLKHGTEISSQRRNRLCWCLFWLGLLAYSRRKTNKQILISFYR